MANKTIADTILEAYNAGQTGETAVLNKLSEAGLDTSTKPEVVALVDSALAAIPASVLATDFATQKTSVDTVVGNINSRLGTLEDSLNSIIAALKA